MSATPFKKPPVLKFGDLLEGLKNKYETLANAPLQFPEIMKTGIPVIKTLYVINNPDIGQYILQKNTRNYPKSKGFEILALFLGKGLITNEGDNWHKQRTLIQPAFHRETLKRISEITISTTNQLLQRWKDREGETINFTHEMAQVTIDIVAKSLFTTDITAEHVQTIWQNVNFLNEAIDKMLGNPFHAPYFVPTAMNRKMKKYIAELDAIVYGIITKRKSEKNPPPDLLQLLLEARYEGTGTGMTDLQIRDEVMTIFIAGHETTVNALSWTWYLLKKNAPQEEKLKEESLRFAGGRDPVFEDLPGLAYGKNVMNESMRLYPPVPAVVRGVVKDEVVGGYLIKGGSEVVINVTGLQQHPALWQNPSEFNPERFEHFDLKGANRFIFMPFGGGPRICIGNNFAMLEMQLINAMLSARVDMELLSHDVKANALVTLKPYDGVMMRLKKVKANEPVVEQVGTEA